MSGEQLSVSLRAAYLSLLEQQFGLRAGRQVDEAARVDGVVLRLLATSSYAEPGELYAALAAGLLPGMLEQLATSMTVGETHFFRVTPQIEALRRVVLPELIAAHQTDRRLRLWSAGCSTGEEPYTLAMLLSEQLANRHDWDIQLVASDLNRAALDVARQAVYGEWSFRDTPLDLRTRYFSPKAKQWRLHHQVRNMVRFEQLNLAEDPIPFASVGEKIDLILCRNVTIYFGELATQRLYSRFADALQPDGWLMLGPSDPVPVPTSMLEVVTFDGALLWRRRQALEQAEAAKHPPPAKQRSTARHAPIPKRPAAAQHVAPARRVASARAAAAPSPAAASMDPLVHLQVGMLQLGEGSAVAAIESLRRAAFLDETSALVQFSLGTAYRQLGDPSRSRSAFARARRLLAGHADDQPLAGGEGATGELRHAVEAQLADLDRTRP